MVKQPKWVVRAAITVGLGAIAAGALYAARVQQGALMHVASVKVLPADTGSGNPFNPKARWIAAYVEIVDQANQPVSNAIVTGTFTRCGEEFTSSDKTNPAGYVEIRGPLLISGC